MTFDSREPGTAADAWERSGVRASAAPFDVGPIGRLVVLAAHPDDETLMAAGLLHDVAARGHETLVIVATDGDASHPRSPTHTAARLATIRKREVRDAIESVAPRAAIEVLGLPDGRLAEHRVALAAHVRAAIRAGDTIVVPWRSDGHPDHEVLGAVAAEAAATVGALLLEAPIWAWHWGDPADPRWPTTVRYSLSADGRKAKRQAMSAHRSQVTPLSDEPGDETLLSTAFLAHFEGPDEFFFPSGRLQVDFDAMYAVSDDPWGFTDRWYERRKRALTVAALPHERYERALEIGCSNGELAAALAPRCGRLVATDAAARAVQLATERLAEFANVRVEAASVPADWPTGTFDLIVLSETGFYLSTDAMTSLVERVQGSLAPGGVFLACHWRPHVAGLELSGDRVHELIRDGLDAVLLVSHVEEDFLLEVYQRRPALSVATATGLR